MHHGCEKGGGLGVDYDFYKAKKCEQVKKEINDGTAIPN